MTEKTPVILHIPHSSCCIPEEFRKDILLNEEELNRNFYAFTDWGTDDLFSHSKISCRIVSEVSRMVCDMERFRSDSDEEMAAGGYGAVYLKDAFLQPLRNFNENKREQILQRYYDPHHKKLANAVAEMLEKFGKCLIIDCHSFSGTPLPYEPVQEKIRPSFCVGTVDGHTSKELIETALNILQSSNHTVELNTPYAGSMIPTKYFGDKRVQTIMIEINRTLYQETNCLSPNSDYGNIKKKIGTLLSALSSAF